MRTLVVVIAELLICALASFGTATLVVWCVEGRTGRPTRIQAESIELTGPGGQIVIMVDEDKPMLRVIDAKKAGGVDRSVENLFSERVEQR